MATIVVAPEGGIPSATESPAVVELLLASDTTILDLEVAGPWSELDWSTLRDQRLSEIIPGGPQGPLEELFSGNLAFVRMSLDLRAPGLSQVVVAEVRRIGTHFFARLEPRSPDADAVSSERMAEHRLEEIGVLVSGIAHDFNNVLSAILGNAELLGEELTDTLADDPELAEAVADITTAADRSRDLIAQMLSYGTKTAQTPQTTIDLSELTREMARLLRVSTPQSVTFHYAIDDEVPLVEGDPSQLRQVVMNLIINAAEAVDDDVGGILMRTGTLFADRALLRAGFANDDVPEGDYAFVEVEDTGCGIDQATLARIFDPFFTTKSKGRGLGLAGVRAIVSDHGGALLVSSTPGIGTLFRVLLPVRDDLVRHTEEHRARTTVELLGRQILLVDDEPMIRRVTSRLLSVRGATVLSAADGHEALELFAADPEAIACVLLNVSMPYINGIDVAAELFALRPDTPVLLVSGYSVEEIRRRVSDLPIAGVLQKPFSSAGLLEAVAALLDRDESSN